MGAANWPRQVGDEQTLFLLGGIAIDVVAQLLPAPKPRLSGIEFSTNWQLAEGVGSVKMPGQTVAQHRFGQRQPSGSVFDCVRPDEIWPQARPTEPRGFSKASSTQRSTLITHETRPPHASRFRVLPNTTFL
jgi:hypothetical protein